MAAQNANIQYLNAIYQQLEGKCFDGTYDRRRSMPITGYLRDVIVVEDPGMSLILKNISSNVQQRVAGYNVWKGITGPQDDPTYIKYWLWAERLPNNLVEGGQYRFRVTRSEAFQIPKSEEFQYGVTIFVDLY